MIELQKKIKELYPNKKYDRWILQKINNKKLYKLVQEYRENKIVSLYDTINYIVFNKKPKKVFYICDNLKEVIIKNKLYNNRNSAKEIFWKTRGLEKHYIEIINIKNVLEEKFHNITFMDTLRYIAHEKINNKIKFKDVYDFMSNINYLQHNPNSLYHKLYFNDIKKTLPWVNTVTEGIYCYRNNIKIQPTCICGNTLNFTVSSKGYRSFCSNKCQLLFNNKIKKPERVIMSNKAIKDILKDIPLSARSLTNQKIANIYNILKDKYKDYRSLAELFYLFENNIKNIPKCECGEYLIFSKSGKYLKGCSIKCSLKVRDRIIKQKYLEKVLKNKEEYYNLNKITIKKFIKDNQFDLNKFIDYFNVSVKIAKEHNYFNLPIKKQWSVLNNITPLESGTRRIITPLELDMYSDKYKFAIEYNGVYWHSDVHKEYDYHLNKTIKCEEKGIQLYHIFENEYKDLNKRDIWFSIIKTKVGIYSKIPARKCTIKEVNTKEAKDFLQQNHLQGYSNASIKIGLYFKNKLVSLMTFEKPRFNKKYEYELIRFCTLKGYRVQGGASKILKHFERTYKPKSLISYANRRWSKGDLYKTLGFTYSHSTEPNYFYVNPKTYDLENKSKYKKYKLKNILEKYNPKLTKSKNMKNNGFNKIYDCGYKIYVKKYTKVDNVTK